ncbi:hypothetical protein [Aquiflexum sp.]|uniref:hypothetical protein n=1 Tax=Aquiflexum sp. TaxID=1872584 RepID=UPI003593194E
MKELIQSPLLQTAFTLASHFGWSLPNINALTPAQADIFLQMIMDSQKNER